MLQLVEDLDIDFVIRPELLEELSEFVLEIILITKFENRLVNLLAEPDHSLAAELLGPFARAYEPRCYHTGKLR